MPTIDAIFQNPHYIFFAVVIIIMIAGFIRGTRKMPYRAAETLLTNAELRFYDTLKQAIDLDTHICMKVRMGDLITCSDHEWKAGWGPRISAKHIDFVLIDKRSTAIKLAIELDDSTHRTNSDRIARDKFVNKAFEVAGVSLLRIDVRRGYDVEKLKDLISKQPFG